MTLYRLQEFWKRFPDVTGKDLALTVDLANRLTIADLRYRWLMTFGISCALWLVRMLVLFALPLLPARLIARWLVQWVQNELVQLWLTLAMYVVCMMLCGLAFFRYTGVKLSSKAKRRYRIYTAAVDYKLHVLARR